MAPYQYGWNNPIRYFDPDGMAPKSCCPQSSGAVFFSEVQEQFGFLKTAADNFFGFKSKSSPTKMGNSQPAGIIMVSEGSGGPMDVGTIGDIGGFVNTDGMDGLAKSGPSGSIIEKLASFLGTLFGIVNESPLFPTQVNNTNETEYGNTKLTNHSENLENDRSSDSTFVSGTGKQSPDGTVSVNVIVKGDTINIRTRNIEDSKRIRDDPNVNWTKNKNEL